MGGRRWRAIGASMAGMVVVAAGLVAPPSAAAGVGDGPEAGQTGSCDRWASVSGDDGAVGTYAQPRRTLRGLVPLLAPGETGCIKGGETLDLSGGWGIVNAGGGTPAAPVTIRSEYGGAPAGMQGLIHVQAHIHDLVIEDVRIEGPTTGAVKNVMMLIDGDRITVRGADITYPRGICMQIGNINNDSRADDLLLEGNRIHDCGMSPDLTWTTADSGAHGIYIQHASGARVRENEIFDNRFRGIQTWPGPTGTVISHNVLDGNGSNLNLGHDLPTWVSQDTTIENNIISNATLFFDLSKNPANVHGTIPTNTYGNVVSGNCVYHVDPTKNFSGTGYTVTGNTIADPLFVDRAGKDFRLQAGSPCAGKGPTSTSAPGPVVADLLPNAGVPAGGATVRIEGSGFTGATAVAFGATPAASFTVVDDATITAVSPSRPLGLVNVRVTTPTGVTATGADSWFTYVSGPTGPPTVSGLTPNIGPVEGGTVVTIAGSGFLTASGVRFGPSAQATFTVVNDSTIRAVAPARSTSLVNVWVTNHLGTSTTAPASWYSYRIITGPPPAITGVSPRSGPTSGGTAVTITGTGFTDVASVRFGATAASSFSVVNDTTITAVAPARPTGLVHVRVATQNGTSADSSADWYRFG